MLPLFINIGLSNVNLQRSPNWLEFMSDLDNSAIVVDGNEDFSIDCSKIEMPMAQSCENLPADVSGKEKAFPLTSKNVAICHHLLNLLCWIPDISARSFSLYVTCIFNLERYAHLCAGCLLMDLFIFSCCSCSIDFFTLDSILFLKRLLVPPFARELLFALYVQTRK